METGRFLELAQGQGILHDHRHFGDRVAGIHTRGVARSLGDYHGDWGIDELAREHVSDDTSYVFSRVLIPRRLLVSIFVAQTAYFDYLNDQAT